MPDMDAAQAEQRTREEDLLRQVIAFVEPLTRYDRSQFEGVAASSETVSVTAWQSFAVTFRVDQDSGAGGLPPDTVELADAAALRRNLGQAMADARGALPDRLQRWIAAQAAEPTTAPLYERDCLPGADSVGYAEECVACNGYGRLTCGSCDGDGKVTCPGCDGAGETHCLKCSGGWQTCSGCHGQGSWTEYQTRTSSTGTHGDQVTTTEYITVHVTCGTCNGQRQHRCRTCDGTTRVTCGTCNGNKRLTCRMCGGGGTVRCAPCEATGWRHYRAHLRAAVSQEWSVYAATSHDEAQRTLTQVDGLSALCALAEHLTIETQEADDDSLQRTFVGTVPVTTLSLNAAGVPFEIVGYGEDPRVYDFKNLVGRLLEADLTALESAVRRTPRYPPWPNARLDAAVATFLESEANQRIGQRMHGPWANLSRFAEDELHLAVSPDYVTRAAGALRGGIERTYWSGMPLAVPALLLLPTAFLVPADRRGLIHFGPLPALVVGLAAFGAALLLEWLARRRVRRRLEPALGALLVTFLLNDPAMAPRGRKWRLRSAVFGALLGWIGGAFILAFLFIRAHPPHKPRFATARPRASSPARHKTAPKPAHRAGPATPHQR